MTLTKHILAKLRTPLFAIAIAASPVMTSADQHDDIGRLDATIINFESNFRAGNYASMMENLPPRLIDAVVAQTGQDRGTALAALAEQTRGAMNGITVLEINMDTTATTITEASAALAFALIPTVTVLRTADGQEIRTGTTTLGLLENGSWTLSRIASQQQETAMKTLYPEISNVRFPQMTQKVLN